MNFSWKKMEQEWRSQLLSNANGNVLEVGVGIGENFKFYPAGVCITATDAGTKTIERARTAAAVYGVKANFITSSTGQLQFGENSFDTIVSTFSLSAYDNPMEVLRQFNNWCKPGGLILLLEYGISKYKIVNWVQQKWQPVHYRKNGSYINRDMIAAISGSGLGIKKVEVKFAGIVHLVWATLLTKAK